METLAERLAHARERAGLSQEDLAIKVGVKQSTIGNAEAGLRLLPRELPAMAQALNVTYDWLRYGKGSMRPADDGGGKPLARMQSRDKVMIPQLDVAGAMGSGIVPADHIDVVQYLGARVSELRKVCSFTLPTNLQIITGLGNSMEPTFRDGDILLVDAGVREVKHEGVYVFTIEPRKDEGLFIKQLERKKDGLLMISHNRKVSEPELIPKGDKVTIHGRVLLAWNARRL